MASKFENLVSGMADITNGMINVGVGAAAVAAEKSKEVIDELNAKGAEVRTEAAQADFATAVADAFQSAGGTVSDTVERLSKQGASLNDKILDELIAMHVRKLSEPERAEFVEHVKSIVDAVADEATTVPVDSVEDEPAAEADAPAAAPADEAQAE